MKEDMIKMALKKECEGLYRCNTLKDCDEVMNIIVECLF